MRTLALLFFVACPGPVDDTSNPDTDTTPVDCGSIDADNDGFNACDDCDDSDPGVFPGAPERCNGIDDDCDGEILPEEADTTGDGAPDCQVCDEAGYWDIVTTVPDSALAVALADDMSGLRCTYSQTGAWMFTRLDNHDSQVQCVYTGRTTPINGERPDSNNDMNVEHTWPQSLGASSLPMKCDLHHLFPVDVNANQKRGNDPFGYVVGNGSWSEGGSKSGNDSRGNRVFEPRDAHKGNVARAMLYMSMEYDWPLSPEQIAIFVEWSALDPIDATEVDRTLDIAEYQSFANPLVACPGLVERIFD